MPDLMPVVPVDRFDQVLPNPPPHPTGERQAQGTDTSLAHPEHQLDISKQYPMYVVPLATLSGLEMLPTHEEMFDDLVEWKRGMGAVLFCSHTWLGRSHPDPSGVKLALLKKLPGPHMAHSHSVHNFHQVHC